MNVGLDFGTSNSSISLFRDGRIRLFDLDPGSLNPHMLRSFIFINRAQETFVGSEAVDRYQQVETGRPVYWETKSMGQVQMIVGSGGSSPIVYWDDLMVRIDTAAQGRLIQSVKTALRNPAYEGTDVFGTFYPVEQLIAVILENLRLRCEAATGEPVGGVVLGRPVKFSDDPEIDARAQARIEAAAQLAGFKDIRFAYEPVAAAYVYHWETAERQAALVFDFGGGTLDLTVVELGGAAEPVVLATRGVLIGGDDLDRALLQPLKRHFGDGATLRNRQPVPAHIFGLLDSWQTMVLLSRPEYRAILRDARRGSDPEAIDRLNHLVEQNLGFALFQSVEAAKIRLSSEATAHVELEQDGFRFKQLVTRPEFERLAARYIEQIEADLDGVVHDSGLQPADIRAVLRTGGSAQIPAVIRLLGDKFGHDRLRPLNPFETIVGGLAILANQPTS
ncbi:MAG TPA: Hsp70 family protein [Anaerolineales bacterium]|nr:Hsp70 family protein [Anaerolineales bacterium]